VIFHCEPTIRRVQASGQGEYCIGQKGVINNKTMELTFSFITAGVGVPLLGILILAGYQPDP
jgi:hypothetical protein